MITAKSIVITSGALATVAFIVLSLQPNYLGIRTGYADENYIRSSDCRSCHTDHYASWARTFHSRMTQDARAATVQGNFDGNTFEYLGVKARMEKRQGRFFMTFDFPDGRTQVATVDRTVGSRRIEQYLTKQQNQYTRLPLAYDLVNKRWMSLNGSFFYPDSDNYFLHLAQWDGNCVFCHNVKAQPHIDFSTKQFKTEVSELGIACGACHGPGAEHAQTALSPLARTLWRLGSQDDTKIVNPTKLPSERSMMICGHCHGQRVPEPVDRIQTILTRGDPFNAGEDLSQYYRPITQESHVGNVSFANRFWANGSPRLTAYEYQGILRSKCFTKGEPSRRINCITCHSMHDGDPAGQITNANRTDKPCLSCHPKYSPAESLEAHTGHKRQSAGSRCYNCHMPRSVYGIMTFHPTHDITIPNPQLTATQGVPNACNQCHLERSVNWAILEAKTLWPAQFAPAEPNADEQYDLPEGPRALFAGDALTRALAADLLAGNGPVKPDPLWATPFLIEAFGDNYPIVRFFAANGIDREKTRAQLSKPDYLAAANIRDLMQRQWRENLFSRSPEASQQARMWATKLAARRRDVDLEVGE